MSRSEAYRAKLRTLEDWEPFLLRQSGLPGPRGNLELLDAVASEGDTARFLRLLARGPEEAPSGTPGEFVAACGAAGLGERIAQGETSLWSTLRGLASDPRWRVREGVAMGLQRIGDRAMDGLLDALRSWVKGGPLERRAVVAGLCEPRLLKRPEHARAVVGILDEVTRSLEREENRRSEDVRVLRQALGYGWSVAAVASPAEGKRALERWAASRDPDIRWIVKENLKKSRLERMDAAWVRRMRKKGL